MMARTSLTNDHTDEKTLFVLQQFNVQEIDITQSSKHGHWLLGMTVKDQKWEIHLKACVNSKAKEIFLYHKSAVFYHNNFMIY